MVMIAFLFLIRAIHSTEYSLLLFRPVVAGKDKLLLHVEL